MKEIFVKYFGWLKKMKNLSITLLLLCFTPPSARDCSWSYMFKIKCGEYGVSGNRWENDKSQHQKSVPSLISPEKD